MIVMQDQQNNNRIQMSIGWDDLSPLKQDKNSYEPNREQLIEYGLFLGLELPRDQAYLYVARQGLMAHLPPFWQPCESVEGDLYFRNKKTRQITSQNPLDEIYRRKVADLKLMQQNYGILPINEESALNQSSGINQNKSRQSDIRLKGEPNQLRNVRQLMDQHITEQSVYSQQGSNQVQSNRMILSLKQKEPEWKSKHMLELSRLKSKIEAFFAQKKDLISYAQIFSLQKDSHASDSWEKLISLRIEAKLKREKVDQLQQKRRGLEEYYNQLRIKAAK